VKIQDNEYVWIFETALHIAAAKNNSAVVKNLLEYDEDKQLVNAFRKYEKSNISSLNKDLYWLETDVVKSKNKSKDQAIHIAIEFGYTNIVGLLVASGMFRFIL
jgi:ankyrin repeat protein